MAFYFVPLSILRWLGVWVGKTFYIFSRRYRKLAEYNLNIAFPERSQEYRESVKKKSFVFLGKNCADSLWFIMRPTRRRRDFVRLEGKHNLDQALEKGKGVICLTAHLGAFTILGGVLAGYGYRMNYLLRTPRDKKMADVLARGLRMQQVRPIFTQPAIKCVEESINVLRDNEILIILIDQDMGEAGVFVNFFGQPASTPAGPVIFSLRTEAKILPMFMLRDNGRHKLWIQSEFRLIYGESSERTIFENTQRLTHLVEEIIRKHPEQWSWFDRRWKTRPQRPQNIR